MPRFCAHVDYHFQSTRRRQVQPRERSKYVFIEDSLFATQFSRHRKRVSFPDSWSSSYREAQQRVVNALLQCGWLHRQKNHLITYAMLLRVCLAVAFSRLNIAWRLRSDQQHGQIRSTTIAYEAQPWHCAPSFTSPWLKTRSTQVDLSVTSLASDCTTSNVFLKKIPLRPVNPCKKESRLHYTFPQVFFKPASKKHCAKRLLHCTMYIQSFQSWQFSSSASCRPIMSFYPQNQQN